MKNNKIRKIILLSTLFVSTIIANSRPISPIVFFKADSGKVILNWDGIESEASKDSSTGYYDFEGYRIYRSEDGGVTWGSADDKNYYIRQRLYNEIYMYNMIVPNVCSKESLKKFILNH